MTDNIYALSFIMNDDLCEIFKRDLYVKSKPFTIDFTPTNDLKTENWSSQADETSCSSLQCSAMGCNF